MSNEPTDTATSPEYLAGREWGWSDGTHPSGVVTHASHRDPEAWAEQSPEWQRGYEMGWKAAR